MIVTFPKNIVTEMCTFRRKRLWSLVSGRRKRESTVVGKIRSKSSISGKVEPVAIGEIKGKRRGGWRTAPCYKHVVYRKPLRANLPPIELEGKGE